MGNEASGKQKLSPTQRLDNQEKLSLLHHKDIEALKESKKKTDELLTDIISSVDKLRTALEDVEKVAKSGGDGGGIGASIEELTLTIKEVLSKDTDVAEFIAKIAKISAADATFKGEIENHFDKESKKKKKGMKTFFYIFITIFLLSIGTFTYKTFFGYTKVVIPANQEFYEYKSGTPVSLDIDYEVSGKQRGNKFIFELEDKKYYLKP